jgi:predicted XRE-type DNA-binding protein
MPTLPDPRDLATRGKYPFSDFGTAKQRQQDVVLAGAHELAAVARFVLEQLTIQRMTQDTLARRAGVSQSAISDLVGGKGWSRGSVLMRVIAALGGALAIGMKSAAP